MRENEGEIVRQKYEQYRALLRTQDQVDRAIAKLRNAPLDQLKPLECLIREEVKQRGKDANALMWSGPIKDIAAQVWVHGRRFSEKVWHEHFKAEFLPDEFDPELCKEGYVKWEYGIGGEPVLIGSTTELTVKGFAQHLDQIHAFGGQQGVEFHEPPQRG